MNVRTMSSVQVWHGSLFGGIDDFRPNSHFGSRLQAYCAIVAHAALDNEAGTPSIYECCLDYQDGDILKLEDWRSPNPQALLLAYCTQIGEREQFTLGYLREARKSNLSPDSQTWIQWLVEATSEQGHKLFSYDNNVEGTGLSYCVLNTDVVTINRRENLSFAELAQELLPLDKSKHGYTADEWNKISEFLCAQRA